MLSRRRNKLNLSLPRTVQEHENQEEEEAEEASSVAIEEELKRLGLTEPQKQRMQEWIKERNLVPTDALNEQKLDKICDLGHGNGGVVHKVIYKPTKVIMARKLVHLEVKASIKTRILKELDVLRRCNSPYIVGFYGAFLANSELSICMEYMDGLSLDVLLKKAGRITEPRVGRIAVAVVRGLAYLKEEHNILHRDVKPSNILVNTRGEIKLCDFGVSGVLIDSMANSFVGTRSYMAPERLTTSYYDIKSDVWSLGLSLIEISVGRYPIPALTANDYKAIFDVDPDKIVLGNGQAPPPGPASTEPKNMAIFELLNYIRVEPPPSLPRKVFSDLYIDFVELCVKKNTSERADLKTLNNHEFFKLYEDADDNGDFAGFVSENKAKVESDKENS
ncbi:unnamed protein product [Enterobius vermicularis]|uniref:mitogen-activated protein kinase kinase n=1 Tax=Enterobius vermicularis TaxID=51028 RepID=A0A0N4VPJ3_ENTVE|nr:unnamed protein product [Enterobius vermicularis]